MMGNKGTEVVYNEGKYVVGVCEDFDDVGLLEAIVSTLALTSDNVPWSGLPD